jgi:hypothetical protein
MLENFQVNNYSFSNYKAINDSLCLIDYKNAKYQYKEIAIDPSKGYKYQGNFFGLLRELNINPKDYIFILHLNGYSSPYEFDGSKTTIKLNEF